MAEELDIPMQRAPDFEAEISESEIAQAALEVLRDQNASESAIFLSKIGQLISKKLGRSLRQILGEKKLRHIIEREIGENIQFVGEGSTLAVRLDDNLVSAPLLFEKPFWSAFAKTLDPSKSRVVKISRPFRFIDLPIGVEPKDPNVRPLPPEMIPSAELPKAERDKQIILNIEKWCGDLGLAPALFLENKPRGNALVAAPTKPLGVSLNISAIELFLSAIEAIPPDRRRYTSISLADIFNIFKK